MVSVNFKKTLLLLLKVSYACTTVMSIGGTSEKITKNFRQIEEVMIAVYYIAVTGFFTPLVFKFKQHQDNLIQITVCTSFVLLTLLCLPGIYAPAGVFTEHEESFMLSNSYPCQV